MAKGKYQEWLSEDGLLRLQGWAREGLTNEQIAKNIGVTRDSLYKWMRTYPQISEALKEGRRPLDVEIENALIKRAKGFTEEEVVEEVKQYPDGKKYKHRKVTKKVFPPDTGAVAFYLKNRAANRYQDKPRNPEEIEKLILENERIKKENAMKDLQIQLLQRELENGQEEISKVKQIIESLDNAAYTETE